MGSSAGLFRHLLELLFFYPDLPHGIYNRGRLYKMLRKYLPGRFDRHDRSPRYRFYYYPDHFDRGREFNGQLYGNRQYRPLPRRTLAGTLWYELHRYDEDRLCLDPGDFSYYLRHLKDRHFHFRSDRRRDVLLRSPRGGFL